MLTLLSLGSEVAAARKRLKLTQAELGRQAGVSRSTLDSLENGRAGELGFSKVSNILSALGLELKVQEAGARRPTLDDLLTEESE